jgi:hypothetical protein
VGWGKRERELERRAIVCMEGVLLEEGKMRWGRGEGKGGRKVWEVWALEEGPGAFAILLWHSFMLLLLVMNKQCFTPPLHRM